MKKILLVITTFLSVSSFSQFIIDQYDFGSVGDEIIYDVDSAYSDDLGNMTMIGDSLIWDFFDINPINSDTVKFQNPSDFVNGDVFLSSDFGYDGQVFTTYMSVNSNEVVIDGVTSAFSSLIDTSFLDSSIVNNLPDEMAFKYKNGGLHYINLPAQLNDYENGTVEGTFTFYYGDSIMGFKADSIRIRETVEYEAYVDGTGVLEIPFGDFYAIKQFASYNRSYSVDVASVFPVIGAIWVNDVFPIPFTINEKNYRWFGDNQKFPIVEINTDSAQTFLNARIQQQPSGSQVSINNKLDNELEIITTSKNLDIYSNEKLSKVELVDVTGRNVYNRNLNSNSVHIAVESNGIYFIKVYGQNKELIIRKISL